MDALPAVEVAVVWLGIVFILFAGVTMYARGHFTTTGHVTWQETLIALMVAALLSASAVALAYMLLNR